MALRTKNDAILETYTPFLLATPENTARYDLSPFGVVIGQAERLSPFHQGNETFFHLLQKLDQMTFGPEGMPMPLWIFYDCSELTGGIFGFGRYASELDRLTLDKFGVPADYDGLVPFSMYIAIPMARAGAWLGHNLASLNSVFPHLKLGGLGRITKAIALKVFGVQRFYGVTQWLSKALHIHIKFGPLEVLTAYTPAHSTAESLTYAFDVTEQCLRHACGDPDVSLPYPAPDFWVRADDVVAMIQLQQRIEGGERFALVGGANSGRLPIVQIG